jgi:small-conductance mechanosensitive channel
MKRWKIILLVAVTVSLSAPVSLSAAPPVPPGIAARSGATDAPEDVAPATLTIQNRPIVTFRSSLLGYTPQQRVERATARVQAVIDEGALAPVYGKQIKEGMAVMAGDLPLFVITPTDLNILAGDTLETVTGRAVQNLALALQGLQQERSMGYLLKAGGLAALATAIFVLALWALSRINRWLAIRFQRAVDSRATKLAIAGFTAHIEWLLFSIRWLLRVTVWALVIFISYLWLAFSLECFPYTRPWGEALGSYLITAVKAVALGALEIVPGLAVVAVIFALTRFLTRVIKVFFDAVAAGRVKLPRVYAETAQPTRRIIVAVLWIFALVMMYPYLPGSESNAFKGVSVFLGLLLSIGSAGVVNQAVSGLMLMYSRALKAGDYVQIGDTEGTVLSLGMFATKIRTIKNEEVSIPNAVILGTTTKNLTGPEQSENVILHTAVTIGYSTPWRQVHALLLTAADRTPGLRKEPRPFVLQTALSDFYVEYQVNAYIEAPEQRIPVLDKLHQNIQDSFNEHGVQIMSPHYWWDPDQKVWVPKEKWFEAPAQRTE